MAYHQFSKIVGRGKVKFATSKLWKAFFYHFRVMPWGGMTVGFTKPISLNERRNERRPDVN